MSRARSEYNISVIFSGCSGGPRIDYDDAYQATVIEYLKNKYGFDPIYRIQTELLTSIITP